MTNNSTEKRTILAIDDLPENISLLDDLLGDSYEYSGCLSGSGALQKLEAGLRPDLILLDISMPEMDGFMVCRRLKEDARYSDIPIIFLTGELNKEKVVEGFRCGGADYITKPYNFEELKVRIKTHIELKEKREELKKFNEILEKRVRERTFQLNEANQKLNELNEQLEEKNTELKELDIAKSRFLKLISHELRTPLNGILGFTELLADSELKHSPEFGEYIFLLKESVDRLEKFSEKALIITELQAARDNLDWTESNLSAIVKEAASDLADIAELKRIALKFNLPEKLTVTVDEYTVRHAVKILIENAINYSPENSIVTVNGKVCEEFCKLQFIDSGKGFNQEKLDNLAEEFYTSDECADHNIGLGLASVKQVMKSHNGKMELSNDDEAGGIVSLYFLLKNS